MSRYRHADVVALVLAAGQGTRMRSDLAKVLHPIAGQPLLAYVLAMLDDLGVGRTVVVIGHQRERVRAAFADVEVEWAIQAEQRGTGHAVLCAGPSLEGFEGTLLVVCGDTPLLTAKTHHELITGHVASGAAVTVLSMRLPDPKGYGRIVRGADGGIERIVEERDASSEVRAIDEVNSGIYAFDYPKLAGVLSHLTAQNSQGEYYLTDTVSLLKREGQRAAVVLAPDYRELLGINTVEQLKEAEGLLQSLRGGRPAGGGGR
jgi:bifunctional UDP-N-acetylglucosamine pyrophosphorylase/glucosamine-1-phosphate N-acetyltransferase